MSVAHCYSNKKGVEIDYDKAYLYHQQAADKGTYVLLEIYNFTFDSVHISYVLLDTVDSL